MKYEGIETRDIQNRRTSDLITSMFARFHPEQNFNVTEFTNPLGIVIKKDASSRDEALYNVYLDGKLYLPRQSEEDIFEIFNKIAFVYASELTHLVEPDSDSDGPERLYREMEKLERENQTKNYIRCPLCNEYFRKDEWHFCVTGATDPDFALVEH